MFGTSGDPDDDLWNEVTGIVSRIVQQSVGLEHTMPQLVVRDGRYRADRLIVATWSAATGAAPRKYWQAAKPGANMRYRDITADVRAGEKIPR